MGRQSYLVPAILISLGFIGCNGTEYRFAESQKPLFTEQDGGPSDPAQPARPVDPGIGAPTVTCSTQLSDLTVPAKILFIVDTSGSNVSQSNGVGTDKDKSYRKGSIQEFFNNYSMKPNFSWGFITFSYSEATSYIGDTWLTPSMFSTAPSQMQRALDNFLTSYDEGDTPYNAAIRKAGEAIEKDATKTPDTKYIVVFLSDGLPSPSVPSSSITSDIAQVMAKAPGRVSFNTIYYGIPSEGGRDLMQLMASVGGGQFLDTNLAGLGRSFPISNVVQVPGTVCRER